MTIGHNSGPEVDWGRYGGFVVEARDSRTHHLIGYGKQVRAAVEDRGFCYSVNEAWRDLVHECRFRDGYVMNGGRKMLLERGSLVGAVSWLAHRWNWTPKTVRGFLDRLENDGMIKTETPGTETGVQKGKQAQVITICNYDRFNPDQITEGQAKGQAEGKQGASRGQAEGNNIRKNKETMEQGKEEPPKPPTGGALADQAFEDFWIAFPAGRKQAKAEARDAFRRIVTGRHRKGLRATAATLIAAAARYAASAPDPEYTPMPSTWLNGGRWEDDPSATGASPDPAPVEGKAWGWWRGKEATMRGYPVDRWRKGIAETKPNGTWPWWFLGAPPGHPECLVPEVLVEEFGYREIYRGKIEHV